MMRSLYSGVSGLKVHQTKMDVIGNNISNVNTVGFKASRVTFSELFYQTTQTATGSNAERGTGGQNAKQIGLGASLSSIAVDINTEGGSQSTNRPFDLKINGDAFFIVQRTGATYFTKAGNFATDDFGNLVTDTGAYVMGYVADSVGGALQTDQLRPISIYAKKYVNTVPEATAASNFTGNISKVDSNFAEGLPITRNIQVYDNLGYQYSVQVQISKVSDTEYSVTTNGVYSGTALVEGLTATMDGTLTFDEATGLLTDDTVLDLSITGNEAFTVDPIKVDFSNITCYGTESTIDSARGAYDGTGAGKKVGVMTSVGIDTNGNVVAAYDNGDNEIIGQLAVTTFSNPSGLEKVGENMFGATLNSGEFNGVGSDIATTGGSITSGVLEMSNVDLASEFTDMIVTQRGFQANSRVITTSDTMIEELLSLKR
ncbi:MAG: flagellar hook protein FlgE [Lachnospiraceae bacterium]|nr:flagellar hook protein FlgE [Lachnospiraceae bacterium]